jgi:hypothetical protein
MTGRAEVHRLRQVLDATFRRAARVGSDLELQSDFARYLCVLVSGFFEKAITELILEHSRRQASPSIQRFVEFRVQRLTNVNASRLIETLGAFDPEWQRDLESFVVDEKKDALDSIVGLRNTISHGGSVGVTLVRVKGYYEYILLIVDHIADLCAPL